MNARYLNPALATERRNNDRLLIERIRALDPSILECTPECEHFERHQGLLDGARKAIEDALGVVLTSRGLA